MSRPACPPLEIGLSMPIVPLRRAAGRAVSTLLLLACLGLAACGALSKVTEAGASLIGMGPPKPAAPEWKSLVVSAALDANDNSPVAVDVVFVRDAALVEALAATPAAKWFAMKADTERSFPDALSQISLELVPSQSLKFDAAALARHRALAAFVFAAYPTAGEHRERLNLGAESYLLHMSARGFKATEVKSSPK